MTVAFDAATEQVPTAADPQTFTHTPVGTPKGVIVLGSNGGGTLSSDETVGVTYGGVALARIRASDVDTVTELSRNYIYFLGTGIPTGPRTVSYDKVDTSGQYIVCITLTAAADTEIIDNNGLSNNVANPSVTLNYGVREALAACILFSGSATVPVGTLLSGMSRVHDHDAGAFVFSVDRQTTAATSGFAIGYTLATDDVAFSAIAVAEVVVVGQPSYRNPMPSIIAQMKKWLFLDGLWRPDRKVWSPA